LERQIVKSISDQTARIPHGKRVRLYVLGHPQDGALTKKGR